MASNTVVATVVGILLAILLFQAQKVYRSPLSAIPGPQLAKWTNLWRLFDVISGHCELTQRLLHEKYGPVVRLGPDMVSVNDPGLIKTIYGINSQWLKTDFYHANSALVNGRIVYTLFSQADNKRHAETKRPISKYYSMNSLSQIEDHIDNIASHFYSRLRQEFIEGPNAGKVCDIGRWLLYFTWDVVGQVTFSKPLGFLDKGADINNTIHVSEKALDYFASVGMIPSLDSWLDKNPVCRLGPPSFSFITDHTIKLLDARLTGKDDYDPSKPDFLQRFLEAKEAHPDIIDKNQVVSYLLINMIAGADTTAITLGSVVYFTLKNPYVHRKLLAELKNAGLSTHISYQKAYDLPYLDAVIREAMRMHPGVGMPLERYVPEGGLKVGSHYLPPGTKVGTNPWVIARNKSVYGQDAAVFRPERWLQEDGEDLREYKHRLQCMNNCDLRFGGGSRICIGKNLALMEVYKVVATFFSLFPMKLADPEKEWKITNSWFVRQEGIDVILSEA